MAAQLGAGSHGPLSGNRPEDGPWWSGLPTQLLTTRGRNSGKPYTTPLVYGQYADRYLLVASRAGAPRHPGWYRNLAKHPDVQVQILADRFPARAWTATPEEKPALWAIMTNTRPASDYYQIRTTRGFPVVVLERERWKRRNRTPPGWSGGFPGARHD